MTPVLYILMRDDLDSMNPGKAMAQASHASNAFINTFGDNPVAVNWTQETTQGFGTVLVLAVNEDSMRTAVTVALRLNYLADVIHDPTYPIVDGDIVHHVELDTCAYVFGDKEDPLLASILQNFPLHS